MNIIIITINKTIKRSVNATQDCESHSVTKKTVKCSKAVILPLFILIEGTMTM